MVLDMSRGPVRGSTEICADCSAPDPKWASINRGVLICDECCSIHRSLGRHISQVKSLKKGSWAPSRLACVHQLMNSGANNIWEYALVDPLNKQQRRKPNPRDQLHPTKADFIRAKYQFLAFTKKYKEDDSGTELSKQLHSSVRTANLETSLRLLSQGADPNFLNPDRGNRALHVAASAGQALQVELLVIYGADPAAPDCGGKTPVDYAMAEQHVDLAHRLVECQYELTDSLAYYLCSRKPDHTTGQQFIIPEMADSIDVTDLAKAARKKLQLLPNHLFEELAIDVYDEMDRRENDTIWLSTKNPSTNVSDRQTVPFLPVNSEFSSTRNQARQKLAKFNAREFATLIIDVLSDAKRRQLGPGVSSKNEIDGKQAIRNVKTTSFSDDEPSYDTVASDEDYSSLGGDRINSVIQQSGDQVEDLDLATQSNHHEADELLSRDSDTHLKRELYDSQERIGQLERQNHELRQEMKHLHDTVQQLIHENSELKRLQLLTHPDTSPSIRDTPRAGGLQPEEAAAGRKPRFGAGSRNRPHSMVETSRLNVMVSPVDRRHIGVGHNPAPSSLHPKASNITGSDIAEVENDSGSIYDNEPGSLIDGSKVKLPSQEEISVNTERITKRIQELLQAAQRNQSESYIPCAEKISQAINGMLCLFPENPEHEKIQSALRHLRAGADVLLVEANSPCDDGGGQSEFRVKTQQIIQCAFDIAKAAKLLVTSVTSA